MGNKLGFGFDVDDGGAVRKINAVAKAFDRIGGKGSGASLFGNVGARAVAKGFDLIGASIGGVVDWMGQAVTAAAQDEASQKQLEVALQNNIPNWDGNTTAINAYVDAQTNRGFADDDTRESLGQLVGVTHDQKEAMDLVTVAEDLARSKGIDLATATDIVTKAHQGNGKALKALGIDTTNAKDATGLLQAIIDNTKGSADAYNTTLEGKLNKSQVAYNEAMEKIGKEIMPIVADIMQKFADDWLPALGRGWDKVLTAVKPVADALGTVVGWIQSAIGWIDSMIRKLKELNVASIAVPPIPGLGVLPHLAQGGTVPGPLNSPQLIVAHGGETVTPVGGGGGVTIQGVSERDILDMVDRGLYFRLRRAAPTQGRA